MSAAQSTSVESAPSPNRVSVRDPAVDKFLRLLAQIANEERARRRMQ
jgi:hypothetical protein